MACLAKYCFIKEGISGGFKRNNFHGFIKVIYIFNKKRIFAFLYKVRSFSSELQQRQEAGEGLGMRLALRQRHLGERGGGGEAGELRGHRR